jgi:hypothetical protein
MARNGLRGSSPEGRPHSELFSAEFPAKREKYWETWELVDSSRGDTPIYRAILEKKRNLLEIETGY